MSNHEVHPGKCAGDLYLRMNTHNTAVLGFTGRFIAVHVSHVKQVTLTYAKHVVSSVAFTRFMDFRFLSVCLLGSFAAFGCLLCGYIYIMMPLHFTHVHPSVHPDYLS